MLYNILCFEGGAASSYAYVSPIALLFRMGGWAGGWTCSRVSGWLSVGRRAGGQTTGRADERAGGLPARRSAGRPTGWVAIGWQGGRPIPGSR